ncbi:MAG: SDR family NAD(P)-dependent oxidoreductase [Planctomycetota bacterium]
MQKTLLITGSTDGLGLEAARLLVSLGHRVLLHGRSRSKLEHAERELAALPGGGGVEAYAADLAVLAEVEGLATAVAAAHPRLDVLVNNAGAFVARDVRTDDGLDLRFAVNTIAPYLLTQRLLPQLGPAGRVVNLSSAAQAPVDLGALAGDVALDAGAAYAQSKLALTMWSRALARSIGERGPTLVALNPGSMLGTKMVQEAFGVAGADVRIGADIIRRAALSDAFSRASGASGEYFDNDAGRFTAPHADALDDRKAEEVVRAIEAVLARPRG